MKIGGEQNNGQQEQQQNAVKDYTFMSADELLNEMKSDNWGNLSDENKVACLQEVENRNAAAQGREAATVVSYSSAGCYGEYDKASNTIYVNMDCCSSFESLDTVIHEGNHAYQEYCIDNNVGYDEQTRGMIGVEMARDENGYLYNYQTKSPNYDMQCDELDSNNRAADFLLKQKERYQNDQGYQSYIAGRNKHFHNVNGALENNKAERVRMQNEQLTEAFMRGDIDRAQYVSMLQKINDPNYVDPTVQESNSIGARIEALFQEMNAKNENGVERPENENGLNDNPSGTENETGAVVNAGGADNSGGVDNSGGIE